MAVGGRSAGIGGPTAGAKTDVKQKQGLLDKVSRTGHQQCVKLGESGRSAYGWHDESYDEMASGNGRATQTRTFGRLNEEPLSEVIISIILQEDYSRNSQYTGEHLGLQKGLVSGIRMDSRVEEDYHM